MSLLAGKVVCITGSSRGIGRACAVECAKHGAAGLILHYFGDAVTESEVLILKTEIESQCRSAKAIIIPGDIADPDTARKARLVVVVRSLNSYFCTQIVDAGVERFQRIGQCDCLIHY